MLIDKTAGFNIMQSAPARYEKFLLAGVLRVETIWVKMRSWLCVDVSSRASRNDFTSPLNYAFYETMKYARFVTEPDDGSFVVPTADAMKAAEECLRGDRKMARLMSAVGSDELEELYTDILSLSSDSELEAIVSPTCLLWLKNRKLALGIQDIDLNGVSHDPGSRLDSLKSEITAISGGDEEDDEFHSLGDSDGGIVVERIQLPAPFINFNNSLGGGLGLKEHIIVCAPTGQGKTIFACQLAATVAMAKKHVVFISTEQSFVETEPRFIANCSCTSSSALAKIPFDKVKDGVDDAMSKNGVLTDDQIATIKKIREDLRPYLHMVDWQGGKYSVTDIVGVVQRAKKRFGDIGLVILDWIGAALTDNTSDPHEKRILYQQAAEVMKNMAINENVAAVSMAQTTKDSVGVKVITEAHLAECKSLHWQATAAYGISAIRKRLTDDDINNDEGNATYEDTQYMNAFKSRKCKGLIFPITREFDYQRFSKL